MGRTAHGFQLVWRGTERGWTVRYRLHGKRRELATGIKARGEKAAATRIARELYAQAIRGEQQRGPVARSKEPLEEGTAQWLASLGVRPITRGVYETYTSTWMKHWDALGDIGEGTILLYVQHRLREVRGKTVANELSTLRRFLEWCVATRRIAEVPAMPEVERSAGSKYKHRTRVAAPELTPEEIWAVIDALPERAGRKRWPVKARAIVAYTTTLRPATLDKLRVPDHYSKGSPILRVTADIDKESAARDIPLPQQAREALDSICPEVGSIFGWSKQLIYFIRPAAAKALPPHKAAVFTFQHFRSAGITHALERSANLAGVQYMAGHKDAKTTSRYVRASFRAALEVAETWGTDRGTETKKPA